MKLSTSSKIFLILSLFYLFLLINKKIGSHIFFISDYLADLICMPWIFLASTFILRKIYNYPQYTLSKNLIISGTIYVSIISEFVFPMFNSSFTADYFDILAYSVGARAYYICIKSEIIY